LFAQTAPTTVEQTSAKNLSVISKDSSRVVVAAGRPVTVVAPAGFAFIDDSVLIRETRSTLKEGREDLIAYFATEKDQLDSLSGVFRMRVNYLAKISTDKELNSVPLAQFARCSKNFSESYKNFCAKINSDNRNAVYSQSFKDSSGSSVPAKIVIKPGAQYLGVITETTRSVVIGMVMKDITYSLGEKTSTGNEFLAEGLLEVNGRTIKVLGSRLVKNSADIDHAESDMRDWVNSLLKANPTEIEGKH